MFWPVLTNMITLCILIATGYMIRKLSIISDKAPGDISNLLINVTVPCLIVMAMQQPFSSKLLWDCFVTIVISLAIHFVFYFIGIALSRLRLFGFNSGEKQVFLFTMVFSNMAFMGFPVITGAYGEESLFYGSMANAVFNVLAFTLGIRIMNPGKAHETLNLKSFINPALVSSIIGMLLFVFSIEIVPPLAYAFNLLGNMTTPLSMIVIGCLLAKSDFKSMFVDYRLYITSFIRLILAPIIVFFILSRIIAHNEMMLGVLTLFAGMPAAAMTAILATKYGADEIFASRMVFVTTIFSVITIPVLVLLL